MSSEAIIHTIAEVTKYIKHTLDHDALLSNVWIRGEISNFTHHGSGHMYFSLKDESSKIRAIMFAGNNRFLKFIPKNGTKVIARGYISVFERDGQYQFYTQEMQPDGIGQLYLAYEQLKQKLEAEGLFDNSYKKNLPSFPKVIGVITSPTGAAIRDILTTLKRRYPSVNILIYPVLVQGEGAALSIANAIEKMNQYQMVDLLIVGRGGGSIEELWAFNEEVVARSIFNSYIPIISAVGHETDNTIADFVADVRAATPTAAAELAVPQIDELRMRILYLKQRLERNIKKQTDLAQNALSIPLRSLIFKRPKQRWTEYMQQVDQLQGKLNQSLEKYHTLNKDKLSFLYHRLMQETPHQQILNNKSQIMQLHKRLARAMSINKKTSEQALSGKLRQLDALSPLKVMQRGYALAYDEQDKRLLKSTTDVNPGDIIHVHLSDGSLDCHVWGIGGKKDWKKNN